MGSGVTNFLSVIEARSLGTADVDKMAAAIDKQTAALEGLGQKATKVNEHPGFSAFAEKVKQGISDPLGAAGNVAEDLLKRMGPVWAGVAAGGAVLIAGGAAALSFARDLGHLADETEDMAARMGLTVQEAGEFRFAMKYAGGDAGTLQGIMRKLSQEIEGGGKNLKSLGIEYKDLTNGGIRPTAEIVLELSERLRGMANVHERNTAAIKVMGRAALEVLPDLLDLSEGVKRAKELGLAPSDDEIKRWDGYHKRMVEVDEQWERLKRNLKDPIAATVLVALKNANMASDLPGGVMATWGNLLFGGSATATDSEMADTGGFGFGATESRSGHRGQVAAAKADEQLDERVRAHVKKLNEERKAWFELREEVDRFAKAMGNKQMSPIEQMFAQRDELLKKGAGRSEVTGLAIRGALPELAKGWSDTDKQTLSVFQRAGEANGKPYLEWAKEQIDGLERGSGAVVKNFLAWREASAQVADAIDRISTESGASEITGRSRLRMGLAGASLGPGQERQAIAFAYQERTRLARELYDFEWSHAKTLIDQEKAFADWKRASQDAEIEHEIRLAELQRRRIEEFRGEMGGLFDALMGGKQGLQQFAVGQMKNLGRAAFANTATSLATGGKITAQSTFGGTWLGDMLGSKDPLKAATDVNTMATIANTQALRALAMSPSGGGGGFAGGGSFGGLFGGGGDSAPTDYLGGGDWGDGTILPMKNGGFNWGKTAGIGGAAAGAGFGVYSGIRSGGFSGAMTATGSALAGAGAIMALASKSLSVAGPIGMLAGMGLGMLPMLLGDPKQKRAEELDRERQSRAYTGGVGSDYSVDIYGRSYDYNYRGDMRPIQVTNYISAIDAQSFEQWGKANPGAISSVVSHAAMNDEQIPATLSQVMA